MAQCNPGGHTKRPGAHLKTRPLGVVKESKTQGGPTRGVPLVGGRSRAQWRDTQGGLPRGRVYTRLVGPPCFWGPPCGCVFVFKRESALWGPEPKPGDYFWVAPVFKGGTLIHGRSKRDQNRGGEKRGGAPIHRRHPELTTGTARSGFFKGESAGVKHPRG